VVSHLRGGHYRSGDFNADYALFCKAGMALATIEARQWAGASS
jgi:type I site-specific restriction endonuclease